MNDIKELRRSWRERAKWLGGTVAFSFLGFIIFFQHPNPSVKMFYLFSLLLLLSAWGTWQSITKPDVRIVSGKIYLFDLPVASPVVISLKEIRAIKRHRKMPILRVSPLVFYLTSGKAIKFSTGTSENRMKRIMIFLETETALKIERT